MIFLECYLDESFIRYLGFGDNDYAHSGDKARVLKGLLKYGEGIGLIDSDEGRNKYEILSDFEIFEEFMELKLLMHKFKKNIYILVLPNKIEAWLVRLSRLQGVKIQSHGIHDSRGNLKKVYKKNELWKLNKFFEEISVHKEFEKVNTWIHDYRE
ncbi:MAG: hypothetical protein INQ03_25180 [Candidatus Heimdallarchaeota archaeon]|nr:hypothetical protein [Candidatus Heimdallarchaeota archaeon]